MAYKPLHNLLPPPIPSVFFLAPFYLAMLVSHCSFIRPRVLPQDVCFLCLEPSSPRWLHGLPFTYFRSTLSERPVLTSVTSPSHSCYFALFFFIVLRKYIYRITNILCMFVCELLLCLQPLACMFSEGEDLLLYPQQCQDQCLACSSYSSIYQTKKKNKSRKVSVREGRGWIQILYCFAYQAGE